MTATHAYGVFQPILKHIGVRRVTCSIGKNDNIVISRITAQHTLLKRNFASKNKCDDEEVLIKSEKEGVLTLTLNRPNRRNALNLSLLQELKTTLVKLNHDNTPTNINIRAVVIQSNGPAFCSGHDLKELLSNSRGTGTSSRISSSEEYVSNLFRLCSEVMSLCRSVPQPTISAVHGIATAAGCQLAASTDLTVASPTASFATPGVNIGLFCSTPAVPLIRTIPYKVALDMLFTGRVLNAQEALAFGLVSRIAEVENSAGGGDSDRDGAEAVKKEANAIAQLIASKSGNAMRNGKSALLQQAALTSLKGAYEIANAAMVQGMKTEDACIGIHSFLAKERPNWKHK